MFNQGFLNSPNIYHTAGALETTSLVTGASQLSYGAKLLGFICENAHSVDSWVQVHDGYAAPTAGAVPILSIKATAGTPVSFNPSPFNCLQFSKGIVIVLSSTGPTFTAISSKLWTTAFFI